MMSSIGSTVVSIVRFVGKNAVAVPTMLYQRAKGCRRLARQLRKQGITEKAVLELTKCYRQAFSFWKNWPLTNIEDRQN